MELLVLVLADNSVLCPDCTEKKYPDGYPEPETTPVFNTDGWRCEMAGSSRADCTKLIDAW